MCLVDTIQQMWQTGNIPQELGWTVLFLINKGTTNTRGIGLLDTLWKVVEVLIETCLRASIQFHYVLHGDRSRRGTGTAITKLKLAHDLDRVYHKPLLLVLLDLWKSYNTVEMEHFIQTLEGYRVGPRMCGLLKTYLAHQKVVPRQNVYHGPALPYTRGTTQGGLVSPTLFNGVMDNVIWTWLAMAVE